MSEHETSTSIPDPVESIIVPNWFDDDLHGAALKIISDEWITLGEIKQLLGSYRDKAYEIMRDLVELGLVLVNVKLSYRTNGVLEGGKAYYKKAKLSEGGQ